MVDSAEREFPGSLNGNGTHQEQHLCTYCRRRCSSAAHLAAHIKIHIGQEKPFRCEYCERRFVDHAQLKAHLRVHIGVRPWLCNICGKQFENRATLQTHKVRHMNHMREAGRKMFPRDINVCVVCGKQFADRGLFAQHEAFHMRQNNIACRFCSLNFRQFKFVKTHILKTHMSQLTAGQQQQQQQTQQASRPTKMECRMCNLVFGDYQNYQRHINAHNRGVRPSVGGTSNEAPAPPSETDNILQRLTSLGSEITLQPVKPAVPPPPQQTPGNLGLVISSVQSVSMSYLEDLERKSEELKRRKRQAVEVTPIMTTVFPVTPEVVVEVKRRSSASSEDVRQKIEEAESILPDDGKEEEVDLAEEEEEEEDLRDELKIDEEMVEEEEKEEIDLAIEIKVARVEDFQEDNLPGLPPVIATQKPPVKHRRGRYKKKKPNKPVVKAEPRPKPPPTRPAPSKPEPPEELPATRRSSLRSVATASPSAAALYREEDQPPSIKKIICRSKNRTFKRRIYPCGQCPAKFENQESRKMHVITVHLSKVFAAQNDEHTAVLQPPPPKKKKRANSTQQPIDPLEMPGGSDVDPLGGVQVEPFTYINDELEDDDDDGSSTDSKQEIPKLKLKIADDQSGHEATTEDQSGNTAD